MAPKPILAFGGRLYTIKIFEPFSRWRLRTPTKPSTASIAIMDQANHAPDKSHTITLPSFPALDPSPTNDFEEADVDCQEACCLPAAARVLDEDTYQDFADDLGALGTHHTPGELINAMVKKFSLPVQLFMPCDKLLQLYGASRNPGQPRGGNIEKYRSR